MYTEILDRTTAAPAPAIPLDVDRAEYQREYDAWLDSTRGRDWLADMDTYGASMEAWD